jgi:TRAP-type C4-dicarboxylate transport system permease small subunit
MTHNAKAPGPGAHVPGSLSGKAIRATEHAVTIGALVAGYALLVQAVMTAIEIVGRKLFSFSFQGVDELGGYALAITASLGFGYATLTRTHTRVDIVLRLLPRNIRGFIHLIAIAVLFAISISMLWYARWALGETLLYGSIANSPLETPLWIPQSLWLAGFVTFAGVAGLMTYRAVVLVIRRDFTTLEHEFGTLTPDEEIAAVQDPVPESAETPASTG